MRQSRECLWRKNAAWRGALDLQILERANSRHRPHSAQLRRSPPQIRNKLFRVCVMLSTFQVMYKTNQEIWRVVGLQENCSHTRLNVNESDKLRFEVIRFVQSWTQRTPRRNQLNRGPMSWIVVRISVVRIREWVQAYKRRKSANRSELEVQ